MDINSFPQLQNLQTQLQQIQSLMGQKPAAAPPPPQSIPQVDGLEGAREFLKKLPANSTAAVFDKNESVFFGLSVDANGVAQPIKIGRFTLEDAPEPGSNTITRADFDAFREEIRGALAALVPRKENDE